MPASWTEWERSQFTALKAQERIDNECITCPKCSSQWFVQLDVNRYKLDHLVAVGQPVPDKPGAIPYKILMCARCMDFLEPHVDHVARDVAGRAYDSFLDTLNGVGDKRELNKKEEEKKDDEIQSQNV